jgi:hypothetical protein
MLSLRSKRMIWQFSNTCSSDRQSHTWQAPDIHLNDGHILVPESTYRSGQTRRKPPPKEILEKWLGELYSR